MGTVDHATAIPGKLKSLLERRNTKLQVVSAEECGCFIGVYHLKEEIVCDDAMRIFGAHLTTGFSAVLRMCAVIQQGTQTPYMNDCLIT